MERYVSLGDVVSSMSHKYSCVFSSLPRKRIMFSGQNRAGETLIFCSPQSKLHSQGFYWVDITEEQYRELSKCDVAFVIFRLENKVTSTVKWSELKPLLTADCMRYNSHEKNHWKLFIYPDYIKVNGNPEHLHIVLHQH